MNNKPELLRLTISLPKDVAEELAGIQEHLGNISRSAAIRTTIREYLADHILTDEKGWRIGTIMSMYNANQPKSLKQRVLIKSQYRKLISGVTEVPLGEDTVFEIVVVRGEISMLKEFIDKLLQVPNTKVFRWVFTACERQVP